MSKALSLKLKDDIFEEVELITKEINKPRNTYINEAIDFYNHINKRKKIKTILQKESKIIRNNSLSILSELEELDDELFE